MRSQHRPRQRTARGPAAAAFLVLGLGLGGCLRATGADFTLTPDQTRRVTARQVLVLTNLDSSQRRGTVRAAVRIEAPPDIVFGKMMRCEEALKYVPHLRQCRVRDQAADGSWVVVDQEIDFGWYAPTVRWTFRSEVTTDRKLTFQQVSGDFKANEGAWEFEPLDDGTHTLVLYHAYLEPPGFVPNWMARSTFRRELPQMLTELRRRCEAEQTLRADAIAKAAPR